MYVANFLSYCVYALLVAMYLMFVCMYVCMCITNSPSLHVQYSMYCRFQIRMH